MKRKRARPERCQSCAYCVLTPSSLSEMSAYCELKLYGVEMWWQACKCYVTHDQIRAWIQERVETGEAPARMREQIRATKQYFEKKRAEEER